MSTQKQIKELSPVKELQAIKQKLFRAQNQVRQFYLTVEYDQDISEEAKTHIAGLVGKIEHLMNEIDKLKIEVR